MQVLATTAYPDAPSLSYFLHYAHLDSFRTHSLVESPDDADIIFFINPPNPEKDFFLKALFTHPWLKKYWYKCLVYNERDEPFTSLPGLYTSLRKSQWNQRRHRSCAYLQVPNTFMEELSENLEQRDILVSFMGSSRTHSIRKAIFKLNFDGLYLEDTSYYWFFGEGGNLQAGDRDEQIKQKKIEYCQVMRRSKFALCPRGVSPASFRIYEALMSGCVPIIISDEWVPPDGPNWEEFCLFVPQKHVKDIGNIVNQREVEYLRMTQIGRIAYQEWFAPEVRFHHMVESCIRILEYPRWPEKIRQNIPCQVYLKRKLFFMLKKLVK